MEGVEKLPEVTNRQPAAQKQSRRRTKRKQNPVFVFLLAVVCIVASLPMLKTLFIGSGSQGTSSQIAASGVAIMDKFDIFVTNNIASSLENVVPIKRVYSLNDSDLVAPKPNPACYGEVSTPGELMWLLDEAKHLIDGQEMTFNENTPVWDGDKIYYYYDETILVITWKQIIDYSVYTISEVKIAHPSQFRRFLADGKFGSDKQYVTTEMAKSVNAVVATSGDFYKFRQNGVIVYDGEVRRFEGGTVDTCFINDKAELIFAYRGDLKTQEEAQKFVDDNNIRFSLAFGPVLVDNGEVYTTTSYPIGEINKNYSRGAVCQKDDLHYLFVTLGQEGPYTIRQKSHVFAQRLQEMGVQKAYALDGGQTTVIAMDGELISRPDYGTQRQISDIIYFATALPWEE